MLSTRLKYTALTIQLLILTGCSTLGPDFNGIEPQPLPTSWDKQDVDQTTASIEQWWKQFNDPVLNQLVEKASEQNLDLEAAGLRIVQARMALGITDSLRYPQVQMASGTLGYAYQNEHGFKQSDLSFDAGWELDVWGKYARGIESAEAALYATVASYHQIGISITAEVARNYLNYRTFQERMLLSERNIKVQERVVNITQAQYDSGNVTELDVQQAKTQLYSTQAAISSLKLGMSQTKNALAVLLGVMPEEIPALLQNASINQKVQSFDSGYDSANAKRVASSYDANSLVPLAPQVNPEINANLVLRRPDLQVAELQAHAQSAQIGVAETALYPSFSLFGTIGINSTVQTGHSFSFSDSLMLAAGPSFSWNIFQYGRIKDNIRLEDAAFQETLTNYNKTLLSAVSEVTSAMEAYALYQQQKELLFNAVSASVRAYNISLIQYENGQITFERLLNSVERMTRSEDSYAQVKGNLATQVVSLYKSLGGGWEANTGKAFVSEKNIEQMKARTNWGKHLDGDMTLPPLQREQTNAPEPSQVSTSSEVH
ncbi:MAG: TolC family protein [Vibrio sp.]